MSKENSQGKRTKDRLIQAAIKLIASRGAHNTSLQDIATECKLQRSHVVYHFKDTSELFMEAWDHVYSKALATTESHLDSDRASDKLRSYLKVSIDFFTDPKEIMVFYFQLHYLAVFDEKIRIVNSQIKKRAVNRIAKIIMEGQHSREFIANMDPYLNAKAIHSGLVGIGLNSVSEFEEFNIQDIRQAYTERVIQSLLLK